MRPKDLAALTTAISRRRSKLAARALEIGQELYGERASRFAKNLKPGNELSEEKSSLS